MVELLVVISIVMLLAAILVPTFKNFARSQEQNSCMDNLRKLGVAVAAYHDDYGVYPAAPLPPFVATVGEAAAAAPLTAMQPDEILQRWRANNCTPSALRVTSISGTTCEVESSLTLSQMIALLNPKKEGAVVVAEVNVRVANWDEDVLLGIEATTVNGDVTRVSAATAPPPYAYAVPLTSLTGTYAASSGQTVCVLDPRTDNIGLAKLYKLYLSDLGSYTQSRTLFHCPSLKADASMNNSVDPFWGGYNTYDQTYNFDQYDATIRAFDTALGYGELHRCRQLMNPTPPADTVVCWCFGHRKVPSSYVAADFSATAGRRSERDLVLWVDGTVDVMRPYSLLGNDEHSYQVPPFLYSLEKNRR